MGSEFTYINKDGKVTIQAMHMDIEHMAAEIGHLTHNIYSALARQSPPGAKRFRKLVLLAMVAPDTPIWEIAETSLDRIEIIYSDPAKSGE